MTHLRVFGPALLVGFLAWTAPVLAGTDPGQPVRPPGRLFPRMFDLRLASLARSALVADRTLAPLNLGVRVKDGVATVWGPVPSDEAGRTALARVRAVDGVVGVQSELYVQRPRLDLNIEAPPAPQRRSSALPDRERGSLRMLEGLALDLPAPEEPVPEGPPPAPLRLLPKLEQALLEPLPLPRPRVKGEVVKSAGRASPSPGPLPGPEVPKAPPLLEQVMRLQAEQASFRRLRVEVTGGSVTIWPNGLPGEFATDFAEVVRGVPGVKEVLVKD